MTQLRICSSLRDCGSTKVEEAFDKSEAKLLYVYDDHCLGYADWNDQIPDFPSKCFRAGNSGTIVLLPLDGKIITGSAIVQGGVCDCMLLTEREMSFVEFKTNVESTNPLTTIQRAEEAKRQLWHTYNEIIKHRCKTMINQLTIPLQIDFFVVFDEEYEITGANSSLMDMSEEFLEEHRLPLFFGNEKTFR